MFLAFKNGVKRLQTAGYNGAQTVILGISRKELLMYCYFKSQTNQLDEHFSTSFFPLKKLILHSQSILCRKQA